MTTEKDAKIGISAPVEPSGSMWELKAPWERAAEWELKAPKTHEDLMRLIREERRHIHRRTWADLVLGFASIVVMAAVAWHYADLGHPVSGAFFSGTGTAATAVIFVARQIRGQRQR